MLRNMPFTALLTHNLGCNSWILSGGYVFASFEVTDAPIQDGGWLPRVAGAGLHDSGQSYGGTTT